MRNPSRATTISCNYLFNREIYDLTISTLNQEDTRNACLKHLTVSTVSNSTVFVHWDNGLLWLLRTYLSMHGRYHSTTQQCCLPLSLWICLSWRHTPNTLISLMSWKFTIFQYMGHLICGTLVPNSQFFKTSLLQ